MRTIENTHGKKSYELEVGDVLYYFLAHNIIKETVVTRVTKTQAEVEGEYEKINRRSEAIFYSDTLKEKFTTRGGYRDYYRPTEELKKRKEKYDNDRNIEKWFKNFKPTKEQKEQIYNMFK